MRTRIPFVLAMASALLGGYVMGQPPLEPPKPAPPRQPHPYDIQPNSGNYAICVISYMGDNAFHLAYEMVSELRATKKLPAFFFSRGDQRRKEEEARLEAQHQQQLAFYAQMGLEPPARRYVKQYARLPDEYVVLVAHPSFKDIDTAKRDLDKIRKLDPPSERLLHKIGYSSAAADPSSTPDLRTKAGNPFLTAFVVPNPTAPKPAVKPDDKAEEFSYRDWNEGETYSPVHRIPGKFTLVVKAYRGATRIVAQNQERSTAEKGMGGRQGNLTEANAKMAHQLADILRKPQLGFDAYVIHMPGMSIVTIGAFDNKDDPRMMSTMNAINKLQLNLSGGAAGMEMLETPTPFPVPRK